MTVQACCISHSPLMGKWDPNEAVLTEIGDRIGEMRSQVEAFDPELVVLFGPDHLNGFLYDVLPQFCIGTAATSIGDYDTQTGALDVPVELAEGCIEAVLEAGVDVAMSARMRVDHAFSQPLQHLFGSIDAVPVIPVFINAAAPPLGPVARTRMLGEAVGGWLATLPSRTLVLGSGGLSHDPPAPTLKGASAEVFERLVSGMREEDRPQRVEAAVAAARRFASGEPILQDLAPEFDRSFQELLAGARFDEIDGMTNDWLTRTGGRAVHEIRTWIAAFAALHAASRSYVATSTYYRPVPEWIVGFGAMFAREAA